MMIKRYGKSIDTKTVLISRGTDISIENDNKVVVYFDAAFSRRVVSDRKANGGFVLIPKENIIFVFDPKTFKEERGYGSFAQYMNDNNIEKMSGTCTCRYDVERESILVVLP